VPHILEYFDLPHVTAAISKRRVALLSPVDATTHPVDIGAVRDAYQLTEKVYSAAGAAGRFQAVAYNPEKDLASQYLNLFG